MLLKTIFPGSGVRASLMLFLYLVLQVYNDPIMRLDMKMRPDDVFCKPACADRHQTRTLILKVKQKPLVSCFSSLSLNLFMVVTRDGSVGPVSLC